jgi:FkbM family methyltransferase
VIPAHDYVIAHLRSRSLASRILRPLVNKVLPAGPITVGVMSGPARGQRLLIYPRLEKYYWTGNHERPVQETIVAMLGPGGSFWDVGAHIGFMTLIGSRLVGHAGVVHAFEPMPANRERLERNIANNSAGNVQIHALALSDENGRLTLHAHESTPMWTLVASRAATEGVEVEVRTVDSLAADLGIPALVKVDVEGAELDVLHGGVETLRRGLTTVIVEFNDTDCVAAARELLPWMAFKQLASNHWLLTPKTGA